MRGWPHAVVLDLDGTLVDSAPAIAGALNRVLAGRKGVPVHVDQVRAWVSLGADRLVANAMGAHATSSAADLADFRSVYSAQEANPADLYPGATSVLTDLAAAGIRVGICTNKPEGLCRKLIEDLGLAPHVNAIVGGTSGLKPKPHPDPVWRLLELLATPADMAVYVGDSEIDALAAEAAGVAFVLVNYGYAVGNRANIKCITSVDRLSDLKHIVASAVKPASGK